MEKPVQRIVRRVELVRRQVLVIGEQSAIGRENLPELRLCRRHAPARRAVVADDVEHRAEALFAQLRGECGEVQAGTAPVLVEAIEIRAPVAVIAGLATVGEDAAPGRRVAAGESLVGIRHDGRDPHRRKTHVADVVRIVHNAFEVAAEITEVVAHALGIAQLLAVRPAQGNIEGRMRTALVAMVVGRIAVDEAIGHHEVHRLAGEGLEGAVVVADARSGLVRNCRAAAKHK